MKKLKLEHLVPYLPYQLRVCIGFPYNKECFQSAKMTGLREDVVFCYDDYEDQDIEGIKPILRPLSDLTKEIEHNGEKFIPVEKIEEIFECNSNEAYLPVSVDYSGNIEIRYYQEFQKLFEWHFDVFGLIEKGLAIDINSIENVS